MTEALSDWERELDDFVAGRRGRAMTATAERSRVDHLKARIHATTWMRAFLEDRPYVDPIDITDYYREAHPPTTLAYRDLTDCYVVARDLQGINPSADD